MVADLHANMIIGRSAWTLDGEPVGRIVDLVVDDTTMAVTDAVVTTGPWGRLLGYERDEVTGPWLIEIIARRLMRRHVHRIPWADLQLDHLT
jgi:sporulation protein YlmC with PRC-barrel domain